MTIQEQIVAARVAQAAIKDYTQEQIDKLVYEVAKIIYKNAEPLAREAVDETRLGCYEDKIAKNTDTPATFWAYLKDKKSVGIISEDAVSGVMEIAHPIGVIGAITPATNPTVTPLGNFMHALKGKNALVVCPAPRAQKTSTDTIEPDACRRWWPTVLPPTWCRPSRSPPWSIPPSSWPSAIWFSLPAPSASPRPPTPAAPPPTAWAPATPLWFWTAAMTSPTPSKMTITAVGSDNGILCDGDNMLLHPAEEEKALFDTMRREGVVVFDKPEDVDKFREVLFVNGKSNPALVGKDAPVIAKAAGFDIPESTKVIALKVSAVGSADILNKEIMGPVVVTKGYDTFEDAVAMAIQNMTESGGIGHTAGIFSNDEEHIRYYSEKIPVARVLVNQPTPDAWGPATNALSPAVSEGCGSWGNNILAGNVDYIHLINVSKAVMPLKVELPDGEKLVR